MKPALWFTAAALCGSVSTAQLLTIPNQVIVYHEIGRDGTLDSVKKHGLLNYSELEKRNLLDPKYKNRLKCLEDQNDVIYFAYQKTPPPGSNWVGYRVDPKTTHVCNREFRARGDQRKYNGSKVLLVDYIKNLEEFEAMGKQPERPRNTILVRHAITSKPCYIPETIFNRDHDYVYQNEVTVPQNCIPPNELIFPKDQ